MNCAKTISKKPDVHIVDLPRKTGDVFLDVVIKSGYAEESEKEFGLGHLLEHYLISSLWSSIKENNLSINGSISLETTSYYLKSSKTNYLKETSIFLEKLFSPDFSDKQIFKKEKNAIINELKTKTSSPYERADDAVLKEIFLKNCRYARDRKMQLASLFDKSIECVEKYHEEFYTKNNCVFLISGYKTSPKLVSDILRKIKNVKFPQKSLTQKTHNFSCGYPGFKLKTIKEAISDNQILISLNFPGLNIESSPKERFLTRIIGRLLSATRYGLLSEIRNLGIYDMGYEEAVLKKAGYIAFGTVLKRNDVDGLLKLFCEKVAELKREGVQKNKLKKITADMKKSATEAFDDNTERMNWISYDLINFGKVIPPTDDIRCLNKITSDDIKKMAKKILDINKLNLIFIAKNTRNIKIMEIKKYLNF